MMTAVEGFYGGLNALADTLQVERIGPVHQAGSDSLLTAQTFFALIKKCMGGACDDSRFKGELFGIGANHTKYKNDRGMGNKVVQVLGQGISSSGMNGNGMQQQQVMYASSMVQYMPGGNGQSSVVHHGTGAYHMSPTATVEENQHNTLEGY